MYQKNPKGWIKHLDFILLDICVLELSLYIVYILRHQRFDMFHDRLYLGLASILVFFDLASVFLNSPYKDILRRGYYREFLAVFKHAFTTTLFTIFTFFIFHLGREYSRIVIIGMMVLYCFLSYAVHLAWKVHIKKSMQNGTGRSLILISTSDKVGEIASYLRKYNYHMHSLNGIALIDDDKELTIIEGIPVVAHKDDIVEYVCREWVDEIMIAIPNSFPYPEELIEKFKLMGITVHILMDELFPVEDNIYLEYLDRMPVLTSGMKYVTFKEMFYKRILDIIGGLVGSLFTLLLTIVIGPMILIKSPGPIFFTQERVGKNGKKFKMYKFRSMYMDAEKRKAELMRLNRVSDGLMFKLENDPRIIGSKISEDGTYKKGIGNYIRDYSLDEFPQFFNVLKGDMSLVGTRPPTVDEWEQYDLHHRTRLAIKPGITGKWQVSGRSNITDFEEVVKLDNEYIQNWNIGQDIKIILQTILIVFKKEGSM